MPDFEIRFYHADGKLGLVYMCIQKTLDEVHEFAQINLKEFARFEIRDGDGRSMAPAR